MSPMKKHYYLLEATIDENGKAEFAIPSQDILNSFFPAGPILDTDTNTWSRVGEDELFTRLAGQLALKDKFNV